MSLPFSPESPPLLSVEAVLAASDMVVCVEQGGLHSGLGSVQSARALFGIHPDVDTTRVRCSSPGLGRRREQPI